MDQPIQPARPRKEDHPISKESQKKHRLCKQKLLEAYVLVNQNKCLEKFFLFVYANKSMIQSMWIRSVESKLFLIYLQTTLIIQVIGT